MTTAVVAILLALILLAAGVFVWWASRLPVLHGVIKERVLVTLKSGEGFEGVLFRADRKTWELVNATAIGAGERGADVPVNGTLLVPAENVAYAQRP